MLATVVLFALVMGAIGWVLKLVVPPLVAWLIALIGAPVVLGIEAVVIIGAGATAYRAARPRSARSSMTGVAAVISRRVIDSARGLPTGARANACRSSLDRGSNRI